MQVELWQHQKTAIERAKDAPEFGLFFSMGCGKTRTAIELLRHKYNQADKICRTIILCPLIICENWQIEILKFSKIPEKEICLIKGIKKERIKRFKESGANIFILNYESLLNEELYQNILKWRPEILICDESHRLKNITAKRTKRAILLSDLTHTRYLLTGTPVLNGPSDLFAQYRLLDGGKTFGKNFYAFRGQYFYDKNYGMPAQKHYPDWRVKPGAFEKINSLIYKKAMRITKEDALDLPELVRQTIYVDMSPEQEKLYEQMKKDFVAFVKNMGKMEASVATLAIVKALRLLQIASGFVKTEEGNEITLKDTPKISALKELLEEITTNDKVLVWAAFKNNYAQIRKVCEELGLPYVEVHGEIPPKEKYEAVYRFQNDRNIKVFIGNQLSGGIGLNLVEASYSIFFSRNFSLEADLQAESRNHRGGSEIHPKITRIDLITKNTIEELVAKSLASKQEIGEKLLRAMALEI